MINSIIASRHQAIISNINISTVSLDVNRIQDYVRSVAGQLTLEKVTDAVNLNNYYTLTNVNSYFEAVVIPNANSVFVLGNSDDTDIFAIYLLPDSNSIRAKSGISYSNHMFAYVFAIGDELKVRLVRNSSTEIEMFVDDVSIGTKIVNPLETFAVNQINRRGAGFGFTEDLIVKRIELNNGLTSIVYNFNETGNAPQCYSEPYSPYNL